MKQKEIKPYEETHQKGIISIECEKKPGMYEGDVGIQISRDGRIWICIDGVAFLRFKPKN